MQYLYLDNLRGFNNTIVPIKDVNFLVGENSTGKTTILNLFYLMNKIEFWMTQAFNDYNLQFGPFNEIINIKSENQSTFSLGLIEKSLRGKSNFYFILLTFENFDQSPYLSQVNYISNNQEIGISIPIPRDGLESKKARENITIKYLYKKTEKQIFSEELIRTKITEWNKIKRDAYKSLKISYYRTLWHIFFSITEAEKINISKIQIGFFDLPLNDIAYIAPIRSKPKRTYDESYRIDFTPEGAHTPYLLRNILRKDGDSVRNKDLKNLLNLFGKNSGLFDKLYVKPYSNALDSPFTINVNFKGKNFKIINTGYGVSQSLPIVVELLVRNPGAAFAIQQPEVHLHPRAQATLGDLIYYLVVRQNKKFTIETHSDFIIDRFRLNCKRNNKKQISAQVLFFEKTRKGNNAIPISIEKNGQYSEIQPKNFRDFFMNEDLALLGI